MYERILIPTDGSEGVERAIDQAIALAEMYDATLHVLRVVQTADLPSGINEETVVQAFEEHGRKEIDDVEERALHAGIGALEKSVATGPPYRTILEYVEEHDIDLVVMGTHGRSGLEHFLLGSVTERVVRLSNVPVLTVRMTDEYSDEGYNNILVPTDGSFGAEAAIDHAIDIADTYGATVHALYVVDLRLLTGDPSGGLPVDEILNEAKSRGRKAIQDVTQKVETAEVDYKEHISQGYPYRDIRTYVTEHDVDLIVMGTHGRTGIDHFLLGSVTEKVIRSVDVPVLTVHMTEPPVN